jgi:hypothetical protein
MVLTGAVSANMSNRIGVNWFLLSPERRVDFR